MRYQPVIEVLEDHSATHVLDVGSGWYGLSWYWERHVVQTDLVFPWPRPSDDGRVGRAVYVSASADALPFADDSFEFVVSLDMLEHLPQDMRDQAVSELARVAKRGVVIGYPLGDSAAWVDRQVHRLLRWTPGRQVPDWLHEHVTQDFYPTQETLERALPADWRIVARKPSGNVIVHLLVCYLEQVPGIRVLAGGLERRGRRKGLPRAFDAGRTYRCIFLVTPDGAPFG